jgi:hypothetical protein
VNTGERRRAAGRRLQVEPSHDVRPPSYVLALVAVLLGGVASSYVALLLIGITPLFGMWGWYVVASLVGAGPVVLVLRALGYRVSYLACVAALLGGALVSTVVTRLILHGAPLLFTPGLGGITGLPSLLVSAWLVRMFAGRPHRPAVRVET